MRRLSLGASRLPDRFPDREDLVRPDVAERLHGPTRPSNFEQVDPGVPTQAEMDPRIAGG
jgi:hypothetical protein